MEPARPSFRERLASYPIGYALGVVGVMALSLYARVWMIGECTPREVSDAQEYRELAISLLDDHAYRTVGNSGWNNGLTFEAYRPPGYPFLRAGLMAVFGRSPTPELWLNVICECIAIAWIVATARRTVGRRGALVAGLLGSTYVLFTASLMTESLTMALWGACLFAAVQRAHREDARIGVAVGVVVGVSVLVRPVSLFWLPVLAWPLLSLWREDRRAFAKRLAAFGVPAVVVIGSWSLRNALVFGRFVWMSTNLGVHNAPDFGLPWSRLAALRHEGLDEPSADRALIGEIVQAAVDNPTRTRGVLWHRFVDLFSISPTNCWELGYAQTDVYNQSPDARFALDLSIALWRLLYVAAAVGFVLVLQSKRAVDRALIAPIVAFVVLQCILSRGDARLLAPAIPLMAVLATRALHARS